MISKNFISALRKQAGFSLVELMCVVGIVGVLAAISVANYQSMTLRARRAEADTLMKTAQTLVIAHWSENPYQPSDAPTVTAFRALGTSVGTRGDGTTIREYMLLNNDAAAIAGPDTCHNPVMSFLGRIFKGDCQKLKFGIGLITDNGATRGYAFTANSTTNICSAGANYDIIRLCKGAYRCVLRDATQTNCETEGAVGDDLCKVATPPSPAPPICLTPFGQ